MPLQQPELNTAQPGCGYVGVHDSYTTQTGEATTYG